MLRLSNIKKNYDAGANEVRALRGISLDFRPSEFVSILGPSGCGKTTMLNIIGGLDQYTEGDLVIDGRSTKGFKDRDWDSYRNHSVGFVFQSYNLIPHQSVLQNVELALSLSGVSKRERRRRAKEVLAQVGLSDQLKKRPGEMSGGQMQRVAIARALVNNPDIILADEPTGALDTETSVQIMELLKEVAKDRLVIMVTHNPDLAQTYSTRIIRMLDGQIIDDTAPLTEAEVQENIAADAAAVQRAKQEKKEKKPSMSFATSFGLSLKNLFTKKGRTTLTAFAGSIGIIGIALILSVSQGTTNFINAAQEDALSAAPLTLQASSVDLGTVMEAFMSAGASGKQEHDKDAVYSQSTMFEMINALNNMEATENDLSAFRVYLEEALADKDSKLSQALTGVRYGYDLNLQVYTESVDGIVIQSDLNALMTQAIAENMGSEIASMMTMSTSMGDSMGMSAMMNTNMLWTEMLSPRDGGLISPLIKEQYELVDGNWPEAYNEILLLVDENNEINDMALYALGLRSKEDIDAVFDAVISGVELDTEMQSWSYEQIMAMDFRVVLNSDCYFYNEQTGLYVDQRQTQNGLRLLYDSEDAIHLKVTGIIRPNPESTAHMLQGSIVYTKALTEYVIENMHQSDVIRAQHENAGVDILTGLPFRPEEGAMTEEQKQKELLSYVEKLDAPGKVKTYWAIQCVPTQEEVAAAMASATVEQMRQQLIAVFVQQMGATEAQAKEYVDGMKDADVSVYYAQVVREMVRAQKTQAVAEMMPTVDAATIPALLDAQIETFTAAQCAMYYDEVLTFSTSTYEQNLKAFGDLDLEAPSSIHLYASTFENKEVIEEAVAEYNASVDELQRIQYTDYVGMILSSITTIIDAITYVLIAFVSISLVVSSIMIGVITLISVQERTKEIGILRAIGASKRNVSSMFNAETIIIGLASGLLGVGVTWLLCIPINAIIGALTDLSDLRAHLPFNAAVILVAISVILNVVSALIPARSAAKKDPVVALRTE